MNFHLPIFVLTCVLLFTSEPLFGNDAPLEIAGFRLGNDITEYGDAEYSNYLKEVIVTDWYGFRKGTISSGICAEPGKIVRISMKYENPSKDFYEELLKIFKKQFGKPDIWEGDAFGNLFKWKWVFKDDNNNRVNLTLQHNLKDHTENIGNTVKLYYPDREQEERLCFIEQYEKNRSEEETKHIEERKKLNWDFIIPR